MAENKIDQYFEYTTRITSGHGSRINPEVFEKIGKLVSEALKKMPSNANSVAITLQNWNKLTGQNRNSCAGLLDKVNSYYEAMQKAWQKYGIKATASRADKKIYFFPAEPKLPACA